MPENRLNHASEPPYVAYFNAKVCYLLGRSTIYGYLREVDGYCTEFDACDSRSGNMHHLKGLICTRQHSMSVLNHLVRSGCCTKCRQFGRVSGFAPKELLSKIARAKHDLGTIEKGSWDCFATGYR